MHFCKNLPPVFSGGESLKQRAMYRIITTLLISGALCTPVKAQYNYPSTRTVDSSDIYFDVVVKDPYRWLEDVKSNEVVDWFRAQSAYTNTQLAQIPGQDAITAELKALDKIVTAKYYPLGLAGGRYFYNKRLPGEPVYKLYYRQGEHGKEILLFDPQQYITGKTMNYDVSINDGGSRVLLNLSEAGSELGDIRVLDVVSGKMLPDRIAHSSGSFVEGSNHLVMYGKAKSYDTHDPEVWLNAPCMLHALGTDSSKDRVIASAEKYPELQILPAQFPGVYIFKNSPYMILGKFTVENYKELYVAPVAALNDAHISWTPLCTKEDEVWNIFVKGSDIYLLTSKGNPMFRLIKTSLKKPDLTNAIEIASGDADWKLSDVAQSRDYLIINKSKNELIKKPYAYHFSTGKTTVLNTPLMGNIIAKPQGTHTNELILTNLGWNIPLNFYKYNPDTKVFSNSFFTMKISYPGQDRLQYEEIEVPSHDGTLVPLSIVYDKTTFKKDGSNIAFMEGYGAYGISEEPYFSSSFLPLLNRGVVMAIAHVRGGGEKGQECIWQAKKQQNPIPGKILMLVQNT